MTRGNGKQPPGGNSSALPRFVDIKLSQEEKSDFLNNRLPDDRLIDVIRDLTFAGYRVGCAWSAETQAYTVSLTCRDSASPNNGLCMTSFAKDIATALALCWYKHAVIAQGEWLGAAGPGSEAFG